MYKTLDDARFNANSVSAKFCSIRVREFAETKVNRMNPKSESSLELSQVYKLGQAKHIQCGGYPPNNTIMLGFKTNSEQSKNRMARSNQTIVRFKFALITTQKLRSCHKQAGR